MTTTKKANSQRYRIQYLAEKMTRTISSHGNANVETSFTSLDFHTTFVVQCSILFICTNYDMFVCTVGFNGSIYDSPNLVALLWRHNKVLCSSVEVHCGPNAINTIKIVHETILASHINE